jgi:hypothetical protein
MLRIPFATGIANAPARLDGTYGDVTHQAGRTYFHGPRRTGDSGVPSSQFTGTFSCPPHLRGDPWTIRH